MITLPGVNFGPTRNKESVISSQRHPLAKADIKFGASDRFESSYTRTIPDRHTEALRSFIKNSRYTDHSRTSTPQLIQQMTDLIKKGADVNGRDTEGNSLLHTVIQMRPPEQYGMNKKRLKGEVFERKVQKVLIEQLLKAGADPNSKNRDGFTPLQLAADRGLTFAVDQLLASGANVNQREEHKRTALYFAVQKGKKATVERLLEDPEIKVNCADYSATTPLLVASDNGDAAIAKMLLKSGANVNYENECGDRPLFVSAKSGQEGVVDLLLRKGAHSEKARFNQTDEDGMSLLDKALLAGAKYPKEFEAFIKAALKAGADVNRKNPNGESLLYSAVKNSLPPHVVKILLQAPNVDVDATNRSGETPLFLAVKQRKPQIAEMLLKAHADPTVGNKYGITPLSIAENIAKKTGDSTLLQLLQAENKSNPVFLLTMA